MSTQDAGPSQTDAAERRPEWSERDALPFVEPMPGVTMRLLVGERTMAAWVGLAPGAVVPEHRHPHEQIGFVIEGTIHLTIDGETRALAPGATYTIPPHVSHGATTDPEGCLVLDIFSPPREDYLALVKP